MAIFTDTDLQGFSDLAVLLACKDTCDILRETDGTDDGSGGNNPSWPSALTGIPCLVVDGGSRSSQQPEQLLAMRMVGKVMKSIMLPRQTDVRGTDRISVTSGNSFNTATYHVVDIKEPSTYEVLRQVVVWREK
jgi:hypothetical protein